jgi:hypothetical protein
MERRFAPVIALGLIIATLLSILWVLANLIAHAFGSDWMDRLEERDRE